MTTILLNTAEATTALGAALAAAIQHSPAGVMYLEGDLGAGKTTLARGLLRALGVTGPIRSPTYTLVEPYDLPQGRLLHMDLYRLNNPYELRDLGVFDDPPDQCWWLVEWPQQGAGVVPAATLRVQLQALAEGRSATISGWSLSNYNTN